MIRSSIPKIRRLFSDGTFELIHPVYCDICGWADSIVDSDPSLDFHFCCRHKISDINLFLAGQIRGYFAAEAQLELFLAETPTSSKTDKNCHFNGFTGLAVLVTPPLSLTGETHAT